MSLTKKVDLFEEKIHNSLDNRHGASVSLVSCSSVMDECPQRSNRVKERIGYFNVTDIYILENGRRDIDFPTGNLLDDIYSLKKLTSIEGIRSGKFLAKNMMEYYKKDNITVNIDGLDMINKHKVEYTHNIIQHWIYNSEKNDYKLVDTIHMDVYRRKKL